MKVPTYNARTVSENAAPVPQQSGAPAAAFGAPIAQGIENVGNVFAQIQDDADNVKAVELDTIAADRLLKLTYDQNEGFANVKGGNVLAPGQDGKPISQSYLERAKQVGTELTAGLTPAQEAKFRRRFDQRLLGFQESLTRHESREISSHMKAATEGNVKKNFETAIAHSGDPAMVEMSIQNITETLRAQATRDGLPADAQEVLIAEQVSTLRAGVIVTSADAGNLDYAREQFAQFGESMTAADRLKVKRVLDEGEFETRTQAGAESMWSESGGDVTKALEMARKKFKGKEEDEIVRRIKGFDSEIVTLRERAQKTAADEGWKLAAAGRAPTPSMFAEMDGRDAAAIRRHLAEGPARKTSIAKWLDFTNKTPQELASMSPSDLLRQYGPHMSDADLRKANEMIGAARSGKGDGLQLMTTADLTKRAARELGILPEKGSPSSKQESEFDDFRNTMQTKINAWEAINSKKATPEVLQELLREEKLNKVKLDEWGRDPERAVISLNEDDLGNAYVDVGGKAVKLASIPASYRQSAMQRIQARGLPVTEALIAQMWAADQTK